MNVKILVTLICSTTISQGDGWESNYSKRDFFQDMITTSVKMEKKTKQELSVNCESCNSVFAEDEEIIRAEDCISRQKTRNGVCKTTVRYIQNMKIKTKYKSIMVTDGKVKHQNILPNLMFVKHK